MSSNKNHGDQRREDALRELERMRRRSESLPSNNTLRSNSEKTDDLFENGFSYIGGNLSAEPVFAEDETTEPVGEYQKEIENAGSGFKLFGNKRDVMGMLDNIIGALGLDHDRLLILLVGIMLIREKADWEILLALLYLAI